ncbi:MAG: DUF1549 domain-containing protein [Planctomycetaceae bacterium]
MIREKLATLGRVALLLFLALAAFGFLMAGLDSSRAREDSRRTAGSRDLPAQSEPPSADLDDAISAIDECFEQQWASAGTEVAPDANWLTVCRRISLAMVGTGLSLQEIRELQSIPESQRVSRYLETVLRDARYHDYWAERFTRVYVGAENGPFVAFRRRRFRTWLSEALASNLPYDQLVRRLITADGLATDRPEVNFFTVTLSSNEDGQPDPIRLAARTSRAFLGLRIDCLQCHNDFLGNVALGDGDQLRHGTQQDFHGLAAFYSSARQNGLQGIRTQPHPYEYQFLDADAAVEVEPRVPYAALLLPDEGNPRERLAAWLTHPEHKQAARAIVSRIWALLFGRAITPAVDNIPLNEPVHPAVDLLAADFVAHRFDLQRLVRLIVHSRPFGLDSVADFEITPQQEDAWSVFPLIRLRPEQVAGSVIQAARVKTIDRDSSLLIQLMKFGGVNDFVERYGDIGEDELDHDHVTVTQRLIMLNGKLVDEYSEKNPMLNSSSHLLMFAQDDRTLVESAYLCVLNRFPDVEEQEIFTRRLKDSEDREATVEDLFWMLLNSSELAWNH